jgi:Ca-activated chloride channel family protein
MFISAVVESALIMRDSKYKGSSNIDSVIGRLESIMLGDEYKAEFLQLMKKYKTKI